MNIHAAVERASEDLPWSSVVSEVNGWRGACIQSFAQAEAAVTETLLSLNAIAGRGKSVRLRHLVGQRLEDLANAVEPTGPFASEGRPAADALAAFRMHETLRAHLAHDVARIAIERNGTWIVLFRHLSIRGRKAERGTTAFEQRDAIRVLGELRRNTQRLDTALKSLRRALEAQPTA